jgi:methylated-DNA-[protein]-cysteine S-methyltransferase
MTQVEMTVSTPIGAVLHIGAQQGRIVACTFRPRARARASTPRDPLLREARRQIDAYFRKKLHRFDLPLLLEGTAFQCAVWALVASLEVGELISYGDVARAVGAPLAHRGVAAAMRRTPYDLLIPAHRVIGADGTVKGAGPNSLRRRLLTFEGIKLR